MWNFYFFETRNLFWFLVFLKFLDFSIYNFKILKSEDSRSLEKILISQNLKLSRLISEISIFEGISKIIFNLLNSLIRQIFKLPYKLQRHVVRPNLNVVKTRHEFELMSAGFTSLLVLLDTVLISNGSIRTDLCGFPSCIAFSFNCNKRNSFLVANVN